VELFIALLDMTALVDAVVARATIDDATCVDSGTLSKAFLGIVSGRFENGLSSIEEASLSKAFLGITSGRFENGLSPLEEAFSSLEARIVMPEIGMKAPGAAAFDRWVEDETIDAWPFAAATSTDAVTLIVMVESSELPPVATLVFGVAVKPAEDVVSVDSFSFVACALCTAAESKRFLLPFRSRS
jgi:hypothetical protein